METTKRIVIVLMLVGIVFGPAGAADKPAKELSDTRMASCLLRITADPKLLPLHEETIGHVLRSSGVAGKAGREVLQVPPEEAGMYFDLDAVSAAVTGRRRSTQAGRRSTSRTSKPRGGLGAFPGAMPNEEYEEMMMSDFEMEPGAMARGPKPSYMAEETIILRLSVDLRTDNADVKPAAKEFMKALVRNLDQAIQNVFEAERNRLGGESDMAREEAKMAQAEFRDLRAKLTNLSSNRVLSRDAILTKLSTLREQLAKARMDWDTDRAYEQVMARQIAEQKNELDHKIARDTIADELQQIVKMKADEVAQIEALAKAGNASVAALNEMKVELAKARIELATRKEELSKQAGGSRIDSLNRKLADMSMQQTLAQARMRSLDKQMAEARSLLSGADEYEILSLKVDIAKDSLEEALRWQDQVQRYCRTIRPPSVTTIGAE